MKILQRFKNKTNVGIVANYACTILVVKLFMTILLSNKYDIGHLIFGIIVLANLIFLLISSRTLKKENRQSILSIIGKSFSLIMAIAVMVAAVINTEFLNSIENILDLWISFMIAIYVPYSFYLFRKQIETIELPPQYETKISAEQLKMPPHAWEK
jgi:hypothetical protein